MKDLKGVSILIAGQTITKIIEELEKNIDKSDKDVETAMNYILKKFKEIKMEIDEEIIVETQKKLLEMRNELIGVED